jgi:predicted  nucleic acid-binding Zn-ribbon protein
MKGVLLWQLDAHFKERSYTQRRELRALDAQLNEAQNRWVRVQKARGSVPTNTDEFATRITDLAARISELKEKLTQSAQQQQEFLEHLARPGAAGAEGASRGVPGAGALRARGYLRPR